MSTIPLTSAEYLDRVNHRESSLHPELWEILDRVKDPEIPVLSIWDLGILQDIALHENQATVVITPTYSGCPAMVEIEKDIHNVLSSEGYNEVIVKTRLAPAWSTDWMSSEGAQRLREYGISPPKTSAEKAVVCPQCSSSDTILVSEFGSTACKALYKCKQCMEPFDYFKCI